MRWLIRQLKTLYPISEMARLIDLHFGAQTAIAEKLDEVVAAHAESKAAQSLSEARISESVDSRLRALKEQLQTKLLAEMEAGNRRLERKLNDVAAANAELNAELASIGQRADSQFIRLQEKADELAAIGRSLREDVDASEGSTKKVFDEQYFLKNTQATEEGLLNPEVHLLGHLFPFLSNRTAIDIGANDGIFASQLAQAGYRVTAFEPNPELHPRLETASAAPPTFTVMKCAIGSSDGTMNLNLAEDQSADRRYQKVSLYSSPIKHSLADDLVFTSSISVPVRSIESLVHSGEVPVSAGLVKIDTEGYDLEVIRGMGSFQFEVLMAEFWDKEMAFGRSGLLYYLPDLVDALLERGFRRYIVLCRRHEGGGEKVSYYTNRRESVPGSWGNVIFFESREVFVRAAEWCRLVLPQTVFCR